MSAVRETWRALSTWERVPYLLVGALPVGGGLWPLLRALPAVLPTAETMPVTGW